jgi:hypothetical protein
MLSKRPQSSPRCPLCGKPRVAEYRPFCSRGCRDRDLGRWFGESYRVPSDTLVEDDEEAQ